MKIIHVSIVCGILSLFFLKNVSNGNATLHESRRVYKGVVSHIDEEHSHVWITSNQFANLETGSLLYVHESLGRTKAILRVVQKTPHAVKAEIIDGSITNITHNDEVNNVYRWDAHEYLVELTYEHESYMVTVEDTLIIDQQVEVSSLFGKRKEKVPSSLIQEIKFESNNNILQAFELELSNGKGIKVDYVLIESLKKLKDKTLKLNIPEKSPIIISQKNLSILKVIKQLRGVKKFRELQYALSDNLVVQQNGESDFQVTFRFFNPDLGFNVLERMIVEEKDPEHLSHLLATLKSYNVNNIQGVSVVGAFNNWNPEKHPMKLDEEGVYEATLTLKKGQHPYYFIIRYKSQDIIDLKVLDPYSNTLDDEYEYIDEEDYLNKYLPQRYLDKSILQNSTASVNVFQGLSSRDDNLPGAEETDNSKQTVRSSDGQVSNSSRGVEGKFSLLHIPDPSIPFQKGQSNTTKKNQESLPFSNEQLNKETKMHLSQEHVPSISIGTKNYRKVLFRFQQSHLCQLALKYSINNELTQENTDQKKLKELYTLLNNFDDAKLERVTLVGDFNDWNMTSKPLNKEESKTWKAEYYIPEGHHQYRFALFFSIPEKQEIVFFMKDFYSENSKSTNLQQHSTLRIKTQQEAIDKNTSVNNQSSTSTSKQ